MWLALALAFSSSTDNFAVGLSVALAGSRLPLRVNLVISACNAAGASVASRFGTFLSTSAPMLAPAAAATIFAYLAREEWSSWRSGEVMSPLAHGATQSLMWKLALPMTLNNLAGGVASGVAGVGWYVAGAGALVASYIMMAGGFLLGQLAGPWLQQHVDPRLIAAAIFAIMALMQLRDVQITS